jgi:tetratricopeptide (TPR) repeat protein
MGRYEEALVDLNRAIALDEQYALAIAIRGEIYRSMGRYEEALVDLNRAIALDEQYALAIAVRGETYRLMGRYEEALVDLNRAVALNEKYAQAIAHRGNTYRLMGRYEEALVDLNRAIVLDAEEEWYRYNRAQIHYLLHDENAFQQDMKDAIELAKQTCFPSDNIFDYWIWSFNFAVFALFFVSDPETQIFYEKLIKACPLLWNLQEALIDLKDLLTVQPQNALVPPLQDKLRARIQELEQAKVKHV